MGCGDVCLLNDEGYRAIKRSSRPPLINLTVPGELHDDLLAIGGGQQQAAAPKRTVPARSVAGCISRRIRSPFMAWSISCRAGRQMLVMEGTRSLSKLWALPAPVLLLLRFGY